MPHTRPAFFLTIFYFSYPSSHEIQHFEKKNAMKQINFKIEKNATESKVYIEFSSLIEFLKEGNYHNMKMFQFWNDEAKIEEDEEEKTDDIKYCDKFLERSFEDDILEYEINRQFIEFTKQVNENGFS